MPGPDHGHTPHPHSLAHEHEHHHHHHHRHHRPTRHVEITPDTPRFSLLTLSLSARLGAALAVAAIIWALILGVIQ